ncbi:hypothetical protein AB0E67_35880 [Streptomyces sp. NPDC032161]|uniref:hypothetical protein n=1 Tax=unclassified Streptomyces TaxID=2593676 RepID=UPI0033DB070D
MSSRALRVLLVLTLLLVLVVVIALAVGGLAYITHQRPTLATPLTVAIGGATLLVTCLGAIAAIAVLATR